MATLATAKQDLSYLLGESSVPTSGIDDRVRFINNRLVEIYNHRNWKWSQETATQAFSSGSGTLPSDFKQGGVVDLRNVQSGTNDDYIYREIKESEKDKYDDSDYVYWITGNDVDGYTINIPQTDVSSLTLVYCKKAPTLVDDTDTFEIPIPLTVAKGALIDVKLSENPNADVSLEQNEYNQYFGRLIKFEEDSKPARRFIGLKEYNGTYTGKIT